MLKIGELKITPQMLSAIAEIDEFKGKWENIQNLSPEKLLMLKKISTIESIGSSNRISGNKLTDKEVENLLSRINGDNRIKSNQNSKISLTEQKILSLFEHKNCLTSFEIAESLNLNLETTKKAVKSLVLKNYITKNGSTKGAWYSRNRI